MVAPFLAFERDVSRGRWRGQVSLPCGVSWILRMAASVTPMLPFGSPNHWRGCGAGNVAGFDVACVLLSATGFDDGRFGCVRQIDSIRCSPPPPPLPPSPAAVADVPPLRVGGFMRVYSRWSLPFNPAGAIPLPELSPFNLARLWACRFPRIDWIRPIRCLPDDAGGTLHSAGLVDKLLPVMMPSSIPPGRSRRCSGGVCSMPS